MSQTSLLDEYQTNLTRDINEIRLEEFIFLNLDELKSAYDVREYVFSFSDYCKKVYGQYLLKVRTSSTNKILS